jgi:hypothetical protein
MISINIITFSQDTTKPKTAPVSKEDTSYVQNFILADHNYQYINKTAPDTLTRRRFLWYPAKSLEDIFNYVPGYYQYFMDVGQLNPLSFNQLPDNYTGVLRHGRPINDMLNGSVDWNLLSRNEISEIELSNGYNNNVYGYSNIINVIQRELFQFRPYTEISFYQDRYENLYFDGNFHQNLFRKLNFNFGITKHSYDGHYTNSDFDKWLGRFNLNFAPNNKLNFFLNVNYATIQKGLNGGIREDTVNLGDKEEIFNTSRAIVVNPDAYEIKERFDVDLGSVFLAGKNSFTKLQFFVSNSFRKYRDEENRPTPNGTYFRFNDHWINYGALLQENLKLYPSKGINLTSNTEIEYNYLITDRYILDQVSTITSNLDGANWSYLYFTEDLGMNYNNINLSGYFRGYFRGSNSILNYWYGFKASYLLNIDSTNKLKFSGHYNTKNDYSSLKAELNFANNIASSEFYYFNNGYNIYKGLNNHLKLRLFKFEIDGLYSYNFVPKYLNLVSGVSRNYTPEHYGNISLAWIDVAFKNKLEYKIGVNSRYWSDYYTNYYSPILKIPANATLDFYIMGRIGKATFGLTFENILDRIIYNIGVYPFMDRGGFLNSMSRFNITWNFFD